MGASHNTSRCNFCEKEIPSITMNLQNRPTSLRWQKFGKCCASCDSDTHIDFGDNIKNLSVDASFLNNNSEISVKNEIVNKQTAFENNSDIEDDPKQRKIKTGKKLITTGRVIGASGAILFITLIYIEYVIFAFGGLVFMLAGIVLCRIGVFNIASCRRATPRNPVQSEPRHH